MKRVLVISRGIFHPDIFCRAKLRATLCSAELSAQFEFSSSLDSLNGIDNLGYCAVLLFFHEKVISAKQLDGLERFVNNGGNLFAVHGALASFKSFEKYSELIGARFTGHDKIHEFKITGAREYSIKDELYEFDISDQCNVRLWSGEIPVSWTRKHGAGTVYCLSPGHRAGTFMNQYFKKEITGIVTEILSAGDNEYEKP